VLRRPVEYAQYTSVAFGNRCLEMGTRPSMGTVGDVYDNTMAESFFLPAWNVKSLPGAVGKVKPKHVWRYLLG